MIIALILGLLWLPGASEAHSFVAIPDYSSVRAGERTPVIFTLSEPFATPNISLYGMEYEMEAKLVYENGTSVVISDFSYYNTGDPSDTNPENSDSQKAEVTVGKEGAAYITAILKMDVPHDPPLPFVGFAKSALNVAPGDGKKRVGGDDVLEIIPVSDLFSVTANEPFNVKVLFKGEPIEGATLGAAYDGLPLAADGEQAWSESTETDSRGLASITPDRASNWLISAGFVDADGVAYGGTLLVFVNAEETERLTTDLFMQPTDNTAGLFFSDFIEGAIPESDAFFEKNNLRWASYATTGNGNSRFYTDGDNQLDGNSGVSFTILTNASVGVAAMTGFGSIFTFTPDNIGESVYNALRDKLSTLEIEESGMIVAHPSAIFPDLGLKIVQVYADGTDCDVTADVVDAGFIVSGMDEGEIPVYWGALVADRGISGSNFLPIRLSSVGEDGKILFDGERDNKISGTFYIARVTDDARNSSNGCDTGFGVFGAAIFALGIALATRAGKQVN
jgi:hypothetical protein